MSALRRSVICDSKAVHSKKVALLADGHNGAAWAANLRSEDFELLCPDGGRAPVDQYSQCHLAQVPPHMVSANRKDNCSISFIAKADCVTEGPTCFGLTRPLSRNIPY